MGHDEQQSDKVSLTLWLPLLVPLPLCLARGSITARPGHNRIACGSASVVELGHNRIAWGSASVVDSSFNRIAIRGSASVVDSELWVSGSVQVHRLGCKA